MKDTELYLIKNSENIFKELVDFKNTDSIFSHLDEKSRMYLSLVMVRVIFNSLVKYNPGKLDEIFLYVDNKGISVNLDVVDGKGVQYIDLDVDGLFFEVIGDKFIHVDGYDKVLRSKGLNDVVEMEIWGGKSLKAIKAHLNGHFGDLYRKKLRDNDYFLNTDKRLVLVSNSAKDNYMGIECTEKLDFYDVLCYVCNINQENSKKLVKVGQSLNGLIEKMMLNYDNDFVKRFKIKSSSRI